MSSPCPAWHICGVYTKESIHVDVIKWKHFPRYWPFVRVIHRSPVNSLHKGQWRRALMSSLICTWINGWVNNREAGDLRRHLGHYDVTVMFLLHHTGTTWMQEIIYCLQHGPGASDRREKSLEEAFPYLEYLEPGKYNGLQDIKSLPKPRLIKSHLPSSYFKRQLHNKSNCPKFVVVMRNPKDVLTSYYHFHKTFQGDIAFPKDWSYFFGMFQEKRLIYGDSLEHMVGWWHYRNHPRVLVVKYEDMKKDPRGNMQKVDEFLRFPNYSNDELEMIVDETSFDKMKSRPVTKTFVEETVNFFRQGKVGSWKELFQWEQENYVDKRIHSELNSVGLSFD